MLIRRIVKIPSKTDKDFYGACGAVSDPAIITLMMTVVVVVILIMMVKIMMMVVGNGNDGLDDDIVSAEHAKRRLAF